MLLLHEVVGAEQLVEELLYALDPNLSIERMHNLRYDNNIFADTPDKAVVEALAELRKHLSPGKLADLKEQAHSETPVEVCKLGDFVVLLDGPGDYRPRRNAHGDPKHSWPILRDEILRSKAESNGLPSHKPNLSLVNCLGIDFQFSLNETPEVSCLPTSLDEVWFCACGVDEKLENSRRLMVHKP